MAKSATGLAGFKKSAVPPHHYRLSSKDKQFSKSVAHAFKIDKSSLENYGDVKYG